MTPIRSVRARASRALLAATVLLALAPSGLAGTWTKLVHNAPGVVNVMLLLPDGTVMASRQGSSIGKGWSKLTPDSTGSYVNGTWSSMAPMIDTRLYYSSQVMRDGRVFVAGGEYGTGGPKAEVYDPLTNTWTAITPPAALWNTSTDNFVDSLSEMLPDGRVLIIPVSPHTSGVGLIYDPGREHLVERRQAQARRQRGRGLVGQAAGRQHPRDRLLRHDLRALHHGHEHLGQRRGRAGADLRLGHRRDGRRAAAAQWQGLLHRRHGTHRDLHAVGHDLARHLGRRRRPAQRQSTPDAPLRDDDRRQDPVRGERQAHVGQPFPSPTRFYEYDWASNSYTRSAARRA
jgi:hypothetical protein